MIYLLEIKNTKNFRTEIISIKRKVKDLQRDVHLVRIDVSVLKQQVN